MSQNVWATIMPFGPVTLIFYWPQVFCFGPALISSTAILSVFQCYYYTMKP